MNISIRNQLLLYPKGALSWYEVLLIQQSTRKYTRIHKNTQEYTRIHKNTQYAQQVSFYFDDIILWRHKMTSQNTTSLSDVLLTQQSTWKYTKIHKNTQEYTRIHKNTRFWNTILLCRLWHHSMTSWYDVILIKQSRWKYTRIHKNTQEYTLLRYNIDMQVMTS